MNTTRSFRHRSSTRSLRRQSALLDLVAGACLAATGAASGQITNFTVDPPSTRRFAFSANGQANSSDVQSESISTPWAASAAVNVKAAGYNGTDFIDFDMVANLHVQGPHIGSDAPNNGLGAWPNGTVQLWGAHEGHPAHAQRRRVLVRAHADNHADVVLYDVSAEPHQTDPSQLTDWRMSFRGYHMACDDYAAYHIAEARYPGYEIDFEPIAIVAQNCNFGLFDVRLRGYLASQITGGVIRNTSGSFSIDLGPGSQWTQSSPTSLDRFFSDQPVPPTLAAELAAGELLVRIHTTDAARPVIEANLAPFVSTCDADFDSSGSASVQDIFTYLAAYFSGSPAADFNGSGSVSVQDIFDFLAAFFAGCS